MRRVPAERLSWALLALLLAGSVGAAELGTLFHTPEERARLDRIRRGETAPTAGAPATASASREVTGFVQRSDGRGTVWIDGVPVPVASPRAAPLFDPRAVRAYSERKDPDFKVERKPPAR